jgi:hypothetical protein
MHLEVPRSKCSKDFQKKIPAGDPCAKEMLSAFDRFQRPFLGCSKVARILEILRQEIMDALFYYECLEPKNSLKVQRCLK